jgi:hypothetical protein
MFFFDFLQGNSIADSGDGIIRQEIFWKTLGTNTISLTEKGCSFNNIPWLSEGSRPVVFFEDLKRLWSKTEKEIMPGLTKKG